jgi:hypothetical protein
MVHAGCHTICAAPGILGAMWPLLVDEKDLTFVDQPPDEIGEVVGAWTNNSQRGIKPVPIWLRLLIASIGVMGGLVVGLVAFFVAGGIYEHRGGHVEASWFLDALGAGALVGLLVALPWALRQPGIVTLFVGKEGTAQIDRKSRNVLLFRDVEQMREKVSTTTFHGIRTSARELLVTLKGRREGLWYVSTVKDTGTDPQNAFADAVLGAFAAYSKLRTGK